MSSSSSSRVGRTASGPMASSSSSGAAGSSRNASSSASTSKGKRTAPATEKPRIDKLRAALEQFSELLDAAASPANFASALPQMDAQVAEAFRTQFLQGLKSAIAENNETLIEEHKLEPRLNELDALVAEADARASRRRNSGKSKANETELGSDEPKDVWRPHLDIETALLARSNPDKEERIRKLEAELEAVRAANRQRQAQLRDIRGKALAKQQHAAETLDSLVNSVSALQPNAQLEKAIKDTKEGILADLGPRS